MFNLKLVLTFIALCFYSANSHAEMSPCAQKMYSHLSSLNTDSTDEGYWNSARNKARGICSSCKKPDMCMRYVNSVNKNTSVFQVLRMLNRIENIKDYEIDSIRHELNYEGDDMDDHSNDETEIDL